MPDVQIDHSQLPPSIRPANIPGLSDDQCIELLAQAVERHDSAQLDDVAALIGRLAVPLE